VPSCWDCSTISLPPERASHVTHVEHPRHGKLKVHGTPWRFSETPAKPGIAPELGEHNGTVLAGLGYSSAEIADFKAKKII
jgi:crotonobetainyl-CoA:carnitine CoA-transferase CaiB-like acyl-CoA transferase